MRSAWISNQLWNPLQKRRCRTWEEYKKRSWMKKTAEWLHKEFKQDTGIDKLQLAWYNIIVDDLLSKKE